jgi:hypothetical protein
MPWVADRTTTRVDVVIDGRDLAFAELEAAGVIAPADFEDANGNPAYRFLKFPPGEEGLRLEALFDRHYRVAMVGVANNLTKSANRLAVEHRRCPLPRMMVPAMRDAEEPILVIALAAPLALP